MKTPSWAIVIGIVLMLFGGCGLLKNGQSIMMPQIMDMQQDMLDVAVESMEEVGLDEEKDYEEVFVLDSIDEEIPSASNSELTPPESMDSSERRERSASKKRRNRDVKAAKNMTKEMKKMFGISEFNRKWTRRFGYIGMFICAIYLMSGAFLANRNVFAIKFVFGALTLSIIFSLIQMLVLSSDSGSGFIGRMSAFGNMFGVILDIIVLIVFAVIDKSDYFKSNQPQPEVVKDDWENF